jgi:hypothetical protein
MYPILSQICTVAIDVTVMCKYCGRVSGCDSNSNSQFFRGVCTPVEHLLKIMLSVCMHETTRELWKRTLRNLMSGSFITVCWHIIVLFKIK